MQLGFILLCLALPLLELAVMIKVGQSIGVIWTLLLLVGMSVAGGLILRAQGFAALGRMIAATREGRPPIEPVVDSMFLMLAGVLLLIPGFITDAAGILLLIPPLRRAFAHWMLSRMFAGGTFRASTVRVDTRTGSAPRWPDDAAPDQPAARPDHARQPPGRGAKTVVIDGEWERVDDPDKRPTGAPRDGRNRPS